MFSLLILFLVFFSISSNAEVATLPEMDLVCENWLAYIVDQTGSWAGSSDPEIMAVDELVSDGVLLARVFSISPRGYVAVPVLKELPPIKAYSDENGLNVWHTVGFPQLLREVLDHRITLFVETYGSLSASQPDSGQVLFDRINRKTWDRLLSAKASFAAALKTGRMGTLGQGGPLLTSEWHQDPPFNNDCPMGNGGRCVVGCVATAAAQIMRYYQWPPSGVGSHTYWWDGDGPVQGQWLSADFSDPYDWANMPDSGTGCSPDEEAALAELCYEVGVAFEMDYGFLGSGTSTANALTVFPTFFRYRASITKEDRSSHTAQTWFDLVKDEVDNGRPIQYAIRTGPDSGHSIVCDGWRDTMGMDEYHINYGWGGTHSDWYTIDNIQGTFDPMQEYMIRNIEPLPSGNTWYVPDQFGTIQAAINASSDGDTIIVRPGTYYENIDFAQGGAPKAVTVRSEFGPDVATIDGGQAGSVVTFHSGAETDSLLIGFTITNGGYGVYCGNSSPTITDNVITANTSFGIRGSNGSAMITYNIISNNWDSGIYYSNGSPTISNNIIIGNSGGTGAGIRCQYSTAIINNNCITGNSATYNGGGIYEGGGSSASTIINNTISGNTANDSGGGIYLSTSSSTITNTILWDNNAQNGSEIFDYGSNPVITFSCIKGGWPGTGNHGLDPEFVTGPLGDYYLSQVNAGQQSNSPCWNTGDPTSSLAYGTTRTDEVLDEWPVDMGYHYPVSGPAQFTFSCYPGILLAGQYALFAARNGQSSTYTFPVYSLTGPGSTFVPSLNVTFDLANPALMAPYKPSDNQGTTMWVLLIPPGLSGINIWFQAAQYGRTSNVIATSVQ